MYCGICGIQWQFNRLQSLTINVSYFNGHPHIYQIYLVSFIDSLAFWTKSVMRYCSGKLSPLNSNIFNTEQPSEITITITSPSYLSTRKNCNIIKLYYFEQNYNPLIYSHENIQIYYKLREESSSSKWKYTQYMQKVCLKQDIHTCHSSQ